MRKFLAGMVLALPLCAAAGTGAAIAATDYPRATVKEAAQGELTGQVLKAGYYTPWGEYVVTCHRVIVGYTWRGWPIVRTVCG